MFSEPAHLWIVVIGVSNTIRDSSPAIAGLE